MHYSVGVRARSFHKSLTHPLGMSDPEAQNEPAPPPQPPRPTQPPSATGGRSQLEADELYARQLAEHYQHQAARQGLRDSTRDYRGQDPRLERPRQETSLKPNELYDDREHSFLDGNHPLAAASGQSLMLDRRSPRHS